MGREMAPMICGGVYEVVDGAGRTLQGVVTAVTEYNGNRKGSVRFCGFIEEHIVDNTERWAQFKLIGRPASPNVGRPKKKA